MRCINNFLNLGALARSGALFFLLLPAASDPAPPPAATGTTDAAPDPAAIDADYAALESGQADCAVIRPRLLALLAGWHARRVENKKIIDEMDPNGLKDKFRTPNELRLLLRDWFRSPQDRRYIENNEPLARLHYVLGRCFEREGNPHSALAHLTAVFRYRPLGATAEIWTSPERSRFRAPDDAERVAAENWRARRDELEQARRDLANAEQTLAVRRQSAALGQAADVEGARQAVINAAAAIKERENDLNTANTRLDEWRNEKNRFDGAVFYRMALLVKNLENRNKDRLRVINQANFGNIAVTDYTRNRDFIGYADMLEMAHRLDGYHLKYLEELAVEYRHSQQPEKAIYYYEQAARVASAVRAGKMPATAAALETGDDLPARIEEYNRRLGGLYTQQRQYLRAVAAFEAAIPPVGEPEHAAVLYYLADVYYRHIGNSRLAKKYYTDYLAQAGAGPAPTDKLEEFLDHHKRAFLSQTALAAIAENAALPAEEIKALLAAQDTRQAIVQEEEERAKELASALTELNDLRIILRQGPDPETAAKYTLAQENVGEKRARLAQVGIARKALNIARIRARLASVYAARREFPEALAVYDTMIREGTGAETAIAARARIRRLTGSPER